MKILLLVEILMDKKDKNINNNNNGNNSNNNNNSKYNKNNYGCLKILDDNSYQQ